MPWYNFVCMYYIVTQNNKYIVLNVIVLTKLEVWYTIMILYTINRTAISLKWINTVIRSFCVISCLIISPFSVVLYVRFGCTLSITPSVEYHLKQYEGILDQLNVSVTVTVEQYINIPVRTCFVHRINYTNHFSISENWYILGCNRWIYTIDRNSIGKTCNWYCF